MLSLWRDSFEPNDLDAPRLGPRRSFRVLLEPILNRNLAVLDWVSVDQHRLGTGFGSRLDLETAEEAAVLDEDDCVFDGDPCGTLMRQSSRDKLGEGGGERTLGSKLSEVLRRSSARIDELSLGRSSLTESVPRLDALAARRVLLEDVLPEVGDIDLTALGFGGGVDDGGGDGVVEEGVVGGGPDARGRGGLLLVMVTTSEEGRDRESSAA